MRPTVKAKLENLELRYEELKTLLAEPGVTKDMNRYRDLSREFSQVEPFVESFRRFQLLEQQKEEANAMLNEDDSEMHELAKQELKQIVAETETLEAELLKALIPVDPNDDKSIFLEVRAGAGGDEAAIFAGDLARMYLRFAESRGFKAELINESHGEHGGYKEVIMRIAGDGAYSIFKYESGVHRVQRVPETEAQGRVHTSTCTVAVLPEIAAVEAVDINPADLRIDTFRASGAGGQHVQKTDSAIRITHLPTGMVIECQDERSQHKNKARAMSLLQAKILKAERDKQHQEQADTRRDLVGTGDRSERIRTYNYPQGRLTDHRINLTLYQLGTILEGDLGSVVDALAQEHYADLIASLDDTEQQ